LRVSADRPRGHCDHGYDFGDVHVSARVDQSCWYCGRPDRDDRPIKVTPVEILTRLFLGTTILTSATGFLFPFVKFLPSHIVGILSLLMLAVAVFALYGKHLLGIWRPIYVVTAMLSLYLNVFVLIVQSFLKIASLKALAPTQTEPAFLIVQSAALLFFVALTILAAARFGLTQLRGA
jgi:hypothetical protein